jgi:hypothetical protein
MLSLTQKKQALKLTKKLEMLSKLVTREPKRFSEKESISFQRKNYVSLLFKFSLAEELLAKESIGLPDIIKILGDRPYPMK